jgi:NAD(P)-dependent dehydrogenase (short-subunit alcohol dehydrogenase family)
MTEKKVWLITGAGRGLGVDIGRAALAAGHAVVGTGRDAAKVATAVGDHDNLLAIKLDVTCPAHRVAGSRCALPGTSLPGALLDARGLRTLAHRA